MGRICTCCSRARRQEIDRVLVQGRGNRRIAARYGLSENVRILGELQGRLEASRQNVRVLVLRCKYRH